MYLLMHKLCAKHMNQSILLSRLLINSFGEQNV